LTRRTLSGGTYLVFTFEGTFLKISAAYDYIFGIWIPGSRHAALPMPSFCRIAAHEPRNGSGTAQIWIPVVRP